MGGVMVVLGTRPEAIKLVPVIRALRARGVSTRICVTAQHRQLLDQILKPEGLRADIDLDLMRPGQSLTQLAGTMLIELGQVLAAHRSARVVVQGDTMTALAGAQAAYLTGIPVAHVEAWPPHGRPEPAAPGRRQSADDLDHRRSAFCAHGGCSR